MICFSLSLAFGIELMETLIYFTSYSINTVLFESQSNIKQAGSEEGGMLFWLIAKSKFRHQTISACHPFSLHKAKKKRKEKKESQQ